MVGQDRRRRIVAGRAGDAAARMCARAAMVEAAERSAIISIAKHRTCPEQLIERECAMEDVAAKKAELLFQIERAQRLGCDDARQQTRPVPFAAVWRNGVTGYGARGRKTVSR